MRTLNHASLSLVGHRKWGRKWNENLFSHEVHTLRSYEAPFALPAVHNSATLTRRRRSHLLQEKCISISRRRRGSGGGGGGRGGEGKTEDIRRHWRGRSVGRRSSGPRRVAVAAWALMIICTYTRRRGTGGRTTGAGGSVNDDTFHIT